VKLAAHVRKAVSEGIRPDMAERGRPLFSIGAVSRMLDTSAATIRTWENRYALVIPQRSGGGQRLYSREQVEQLRFVKSEMAEGRRPSEAHRLLAERMADGGDPGSGRLRVLLAENRFEAAEVLRRLLGSDTVAELPRDASVVFVDTGDTDFEELTGQLRDSGIKVRQLG
jgi:DNA-binding transcriptional MerR regulator